MCVLRCISNMALIETCFKKITGVFGDYSEQQLVDCGYGKDVGNGCMAKGCNGSYPWAYAKLIVAENIALNHQSLYP